MLWDEMQQRQRRLAGVFVPGAMHQAFEASRLGRQTIKAAKGRALTLTAHSWNLFGTFRRTSMFVV